jgi:DNA-binding CsgD family transcriptional regulator
MTDLLIWNKKVAKAWQAKSVVELEYAIQELLHEIVEFDDCFVAFFSSGVPPILGFPSSCSDEYVNGPYLLDPFYQAWKRGASDGVYLQDDLINNRLSVRSYLENYFASTGLTGEAGFLMTLSAEVSAHLSIGRTRNGAKFSAREMEELASALPIMPQLLQKLWKMMPHVSEQRIQEAQSFHDRLSVAFETFGSSVLTPREVEISQLLLKGVSPKSIASLHEIAIGTVRNHLKSIYRKLDVTSQIELAGLFWEAVFEMPVEHQSDPLLSRCG